MTNKKLINSFKLSDSDNGKFLKLDSSGNLIGEDIQPVAYETLSHDNNILKQYGINYITVTTEFTIAGFNGPNINTDNITGIIVHYYLPSRGKSDSYNSQFFASYPWSQDIVQISANMGTYAASSHRATQHAGTFIVPINKGQVSVNLALFDGSAATECFYEILGVVQSG